MNLLRADGRRPLVIGHRGAAAVAPENTLASLRAAVAAGADLVEFDVGPDLRLGHSSWEVPSEQLTLDDALGFLGTHGLGVHLDAKLPGYEPQVVEALTRHGFEDQPLVSTAFAVSSRRLAEIAPSLPRAIGYPRDRYGVSRIPWPAGLTHAGARALRQAMPLRLPLLLGRSRATVLSLHHTLCSRAAVGVAHRRGIPVLGWTANDPATVRRLAAVGVDGIVSDDPRNGAGYTDRAVKRLLAAGLFALGLAAAGAFSGTVIADVTTSTTTTAATTTAPATTTATTTTATTTTTPTHRRAGDGSGRCARRGRARRRPQARRGRRRGAGRLRPAARGRRRPAASSSSTRKAFASAYVATAVAKARIAQPHERSSSSSPFAARRCARGRRRWSSASHGDLSTRPSRSSRDIR